MSLLRNGPKIVVKFSVYEHLLVLLVRAGMILPFAATISAVLSSLFVTMLFAPVDAVRMCVILDRPVRANVLFRGVHWAVMRTVVSNAIGYTLLEWWSPR